MDGSSANGWEIRVKIQQLLGQRNVGNGSVAQMEAQSQGGHQAGQGATSCFSPQGQEEDRCLADKPTNQPPRKAVLKSEANLTLDKNAQCQFPFTHGAPKPLSITGILLPNLRWGGWTWGSPGKWCQGPT